MVMTTKKPMITKKALMMKRWKAAIAAKTITAKTIVAKRGKKKIKQTLERFHVIATNANGIPLDTPGWTATLTRVGTTRTADFDDFGVARFNINTLTTVSYTLRVRNADGEQQAQRAVPADLEVIVVRIV